MPALPRAVRYSTTPAPAAVGTISPPAWRSTSSTPVFSLEISALKCVIPWERAWSARRSSSSVPSPRRCHASITVTATSATPAPRLEADEARHPHAPAAGVVAGAERLVPVAVHVDR